MPRFVEIVFAALGIILFLPVLLTAALLVKLHDGVPILYKGRRVGMDGCEPFLLKFRSMVHGADRQGGALTPAADHRITPIGRFLRKYKLDELPQLLNVLGGDMSFVGPRPEDPRFVALYLPAQRHVLSVRPGNTSPASLSYRDESAVLSGEWCVIVLAQVLPSSLPRLIAC